MLVCVCVCVCVYIDITQNRSVSFKYWNFYKKPSLSLSLSLTHTHTHTHTISTYHPSFLAGFLDCTQCLYRTGASKWIGEHIKKVIYEFYIASPAEHRMSHWSYFDILCDGWQVAIQLRFCWMFLPDSTQQACVAVF